MPKYAKYAPEMRKAANFYQRWSMDIEPALRPVFNVVDKINNFPFILGRTKGPVSALEQTIYNHHATQGVVRAGSGIPRYVDMRKAVRAVNPEVWNTVEAGIGVFTGNMIRLGSRSEIVQRALHWGRCWAITRPSTRTC